MPERASASTASNLAGDPFVATIDVGSSSVRTMLFDAQGRAVDGLGVQIEYQLSTTEDGGVEIEADRLAGLAIQALDKLHADMDSRDLRASAVACCTFWHNVLGVSHDGRAVTAVLHPFDTRAVRAAEEISQRVDNRAQHARTGCVLHPSYLPAKLLWLAETQPQAFSSAAQWMSFGEYLYLQIGGRAAASVSMVSGSGLWNQNENRYDDEILSALPVNSSQLAAVSEMDQPLASLRPQFVARWPKLSDIPWFPAWGDGACSNIGVGADSPACFALMVGTSGALRAVCDAPHLEIPPGLFCYRVDRNRFVLGGALSNGGDVYAWMKRVLALPASDEEIESQLAKPGPLSLTVLPLFNGERSPHWRADARAAITGLAAATQPIDILSAALAAVSVRFRLLYDMMAKRFGEPREVIASGGALLHSPAWTQMMSDALDHRVTVCLESEGSSRGVALLALERLGVIRRAGDLPARMGRVFEPVSARRAAYDDFLRRQENLYARLYGGE